MDNYEDNVAPPAEPEWWHATIRFPGDAEVSPEAAAKLSAALTGTGRRFHFLRKEGGLRLRTDRPVDTLLDQLVADEVAAGWVSGIYEAETDAFGGPQGMAIAHALFCADSPAALAETGSRDNRERCILLLSSMYRAAGLDPFEVGDVWAKIGDLRPPIDAPAEDRRAAAITTMRRLMNADAAKRSHPEPGWVQRVAAFENAGRHLARLAKEGHLKRGLRAVLAHHAIFAFNRNNTPVAEQAAAAWLGWQAAFGDSGPAAASTSQSPPATPTFTRMETAISTPADPTKLREAMVARYIDTGHLRTQEIIEAFRTVERHTFVPDADVEAAYVDDAVPIKHDTGGEMVSCISAPSIVATQLEQVGARPGHNILEAGAATGYNAALLGHLVAPTGRVWTIDVDQDLVDTARTHLAAARVGNVTAVLGDGAAGLPDHAPFDRIQFTVGTGDIPTTVLDQLAPDGRLVIPMRIRGSISRSFAFERDGDTWRTVSCEMATFVPLRKGICDDIYTRVQIAGEGDVHLETFSEQLVDRKAMRTILDTPAHPIYTGVKFRQGDPWQWVYLWLACVLPNGLSRMPGQRAGFTPHFAWGSMAALDRDTLAYLTLREGQDTEGRFWAIGVIGHGPRSAVLAEQVATAIEEWDRDHGNHAPAPGFRMATGDNRDQLKAADPRFIIDKPASRLVIDWP
ncbi:methyltransferase, FxLD system [Nonomuraea rubra]|uniref:Protein-L-isoaspartate O-methyltransferase n=1 Tax=Nonomuraea rubra TaxID=46180 RepID=A0A7X0NP08_9ACTN|nr:methyltransferase, FxLD system [Nonomuraea rubra]MBB6546889.1 protein-L-isoaspartate(D-aspartate) O-methyltransferase [Nonomuraea rubra]